MNKLLVICGPTATGKTALAVSLAKKFNGEIVSADSRQVYKGMDIGTGKDLPKDAKIKYPWFGKYGYYVIGGVKMWGYDIADPRHEFSVSQYLNFAQKIIKDMVKRGKLPILVGGTGLYIKGVIDGIPTASVPKNSHLRKNLEGRTTSDLFDILAQIDAVKAGQMNSSDSKNPRRLVRAIEIATWNIDNANKDKLKKKELPQMDLLMIGVSCSSTTLERRIKDRVLERIEKGVEKEIEFLLKKHVGWNMQAMSSMGYGVWRDFFEGGVEDKTVIVDEWTREEVRYAKRQVVWWKHDRRINWFDIGSPLYSKKVEKLVEKWYKMLTDAEKN